MEEYQGKVAIVTGGSRGIGRAYAKALLSIGVKVCIADVRDEDAIEFIGSLPDLQKARTSFLKCDVTDYEEFKGIFEKTISAFGRIDILVNNAGIYNEFQWRRVLEVNLIGVLHGIQLALEFMDKNKNGSGGQVINTASVAGFMAFPQSPVYTASKHGVVGLTKSFGSEYYKRKKGITVNAICPGAVETELLKTAPKFSLDEQETKKLLDTMESIQPDNVADGLLKLLADRKNGALLQADEKGLNYVD